MEEVEVEVEVVEEHQQLDEVDEGVEEEVVETQEGEDYDEETEDETEEGEEQDEEGEDDEPEEVEINFGGEKLVLRKGEVPDELLSKTQDYVKSVEAAHTRRSQDLAEQRKQVEQQVQTFERLNQMSDQALQSYATGQAILNQLNDPQYSDQEIDRLWRSDRQEDRDTARILTDRKAQLNQQYNQALSITKQLEDQQTQAQQEYHAAQMQAGKEKLESKYAGFTDLHAPKVVDYVVNNYGINSEEAQDWPLNPAFTEMAYKAMMYDDLKAKTRTKPKSKTKKAEPIKGEKSQKQAKQRYDLNKDADKMSADEWRKRRLAQKQRS